MNRDHTTIDELLAARALDGLDADDAARLERAMADHGDCDTCRRLEAEHRETAAMLAFALDPRPVDPAIADRIVGEAQPAADRRSRGWQAAFGIAAAVAAALAFVMIARPSAEDLLRGRRVVTFEGGTGELAAAYVPGEGDVIVFGSGLPDPGSGNVYELWLISQGAATRGACLATPGGSLGAQVDADVSEADVLAVTVESSACPDAPTTDPLYTATLR